MHSDRNRAEDVPNDRVGATQFDCMALKHQVGKAVMEASGGYERVWAKALRQAGLEVRIVDPKRVRSFAEWLDALQKTIRSTRR